MSKLNYCRTFSRIDIPMYSTTLKIKSALSEESYLSFYREMKQEYVKDLDVVFNYGDIGRKMYFIVKGEVAILLPFESQNKTHITRIQSFQDYIIQNYPDFKLIALKKEGEYFGEIALEQRIPRTATVIAKTSCHFGVLTFDSFQKILGQFQQQTLQQKFAFFTSIPLFSKWLKSEIYTLLQSCEEKYISTNSIIYKKNSLANHIFLIKKGEVLVENWILKPNTNSIQPKNERRTLAILSCGQFFGDYELDFRNLKATIFRSTQAIARVDTVVYSVRINHFLNCFDSFDNIDELKAQIDNKYNFIQGLHLNAEVKDIQIAKKVDFTQVGSVYFQNLKINNEIQKLQNQIQKFKKVKARKELNEKIILMEDPVISIKNMFSEKFSFTVPFRFHPLNSEQEIITSGRRNSGKKISEKVVVGNVNRSTIQEILYKHEKENQRRVQLQVMHRFEQQDGGKKKAARNYPARSMSQQLCIRRKKINSEPNFRRVIMSKQIIPPPCQIQMPFGDVAGIDMAKEQSIGCSSRQFLFADPLTSRRSSVASLNYQLPDSVCSSQELKYKFQIYRELSKQ